MEFRSVERAVREYRRAYEETLSSHPDAKNLMRRYAMREPPLNDIQESLFTERLLERVVISAIKEQRLGLSALTLGMHLHPSRIVQAVVYTIAEEMGCVGAVLHLRIDVFSTLMRSGIF